MFLAVHPQISSREFAGALDVCPPQERRDAQHQQIGVEGLCHVVVDAEREPALFGGLVVQRGQEEDGQFFVRFADAPGERESVHARHHDVGDHKVGGAVFQRLPCLLPVCAGDRLVTFLCEAGADERVQVFIVLCQKNLNHVLPPCGAAYVPYYRARLFPNC